MSAVPSARPRPLHFAAFVMNATGHAIQAPWRRTPARQADFDELERWVRLARTLERGRFDAVFFLDLPNKEEKEGIWRIYRGQFDSSRPDSGKPITGADLRAALDAVLAGKPVPADQKPSIGCNIKWQP